MRILQINYTPASILEGVSSLLTFTFKVIGDDITQEEYNTLSVKQMFINGIGGLPLLF